MSRRAPVLPRALEQHSKLDKLPEARHVVRPELIAGLAGAPMEIARWFHEFFFDHAELAAVGHGCLVLLDAVIGRPSPLLREIRCWGSTIDGTRMLHMSTHELTQAFGLDPDEGDFLCTETMLFVGALDASPCLGDDELERQTIASLVVRTTSMLASVAPYVRIGDGVVWAYRPTSMLTYIDRSQ